MNHYLTAIIHREGEGYVGLCPELDIASQGESIEEARDNLREAVQLFFESASPQEIERITYREMYVTGLEVTVG
ncbi:MAG: type II toxin-antitoxin system HicB family antitoxin [Planctomycetaceae bacterium]|nr:type II toxin-antitoxin system HicB family antitoxin [Planctomycetaceae bacterium]